MITKRDIKKEETEEEKKKRKEKENKDKMIVVDLHDEDTGAYAGKVVIK